MFPPSRFDDCLESNPPFIETIEGCEEHLLEFFSGRGLISQRVPDEEHRKTHDEKYAREVDFDAVDTAKGKPFYKKFRKDDINTRSQCDAQYTNNLHTYYGDGSKLKPTAKAHYAVDFVCPNHADSEATTKLKNLEVFHRKKAVRNWVKKHRSLGFLPSLRRRSVSCPDLNFHIEQGAHITNPNARFTADKFASIFNIDEDFKAPANYPPNDESYLCRNISTTANFLITRVNAFEHNVGTIGIGKVLFSNEKNYAYVIPAKFDTNKLLKDFSEHFKKWFNNLPPANRKMFGTENEAKSKAKFTNRKPVPYYYRVNVILFLPEFEEEGTMFRRARHVCDVSNSHPIRSVYFEIDTGMLRTVETNESHVRRMPQEFAHVPTPILEVRFEGAKTQDDVTERIDEIRKTGTAYIGRFISGNRIDEQQKHYMGGNNGKKWCDIECAVLMPLKKYPSPLLTTLFCCEKECMGLCCTEKYLRKSEVSPSSIIIPSPWVADKKEKQFFDRSPKKFKYPATSNYLQRPNIDTFFK